MRTLVTGGAGFIGSHVVRELVGRGDDVVVLDSMEEQVHGGAPADLPASVELIVGDVGDEASADRALAGADRVVHLAAAVGVGQSMYEIARYTELNTMATARFLERLVALRPLPSRLVVASSMSIYGEGEYTCETHGHQSPGPRAEEQLLAREWELPCPECRQPLRPLPTSEAKPLLPTSIYAINKRDHEEMSLVIGAAYGIPTVALRFFNVYGEGQALSNPYTGVAAIFASRLLNQHPPMVFEDGEQSRDFTHVSDIVAGSSGRSSPTPLPGTQSTSAPDARPPSPASPKSSPRASVPRSRRSSTASTGPETSATATPTSRAPNGCSATRRR